MEEKAMSHWIPSIIGKIGLQPSKYRPQRPSTHFSCWQISQLQSFFSDMPMEKLWMWYVARVFGLDSIPPKLICHQHPMIYWKWSGATVALTAAASAAVAKNMDWSVLWHVGSVVELHVSMQVHLWQMKKKPMMKSPKCINWLLRDASMTYL